MKKNIYFTLFCIAISILAICFYKHSNSLEVYGSGESFFIVDETLFLLPISIAEKLKDERILDVVLNKEHFNINDAVSEFGLGPNNMASLFGEGSPIRFSFNSNQVLVEDYEFLTENTTIWDFQGLGPEFSSFYESVKPGDDFVALYPMLIFKDGSYILTIVRFGAKIHAGFFLIPADDNMNGNVLYFSSLISIEMTGKPFLNNSIFDNKMVFYEFDNLHLKEFSTIPFGRNRNDRVLKNGAYIEAVPSQNP